MNCPKCNSEQPEDAVWCKECGCNLADAQALKENKCPKCGAELAPGAKFCVVCGRKLLDEQMLVEARAPPKPEGIMMKCRRCGRTCEHRVVGPPTPRAAPHLSGGTQNLSGQAGKGMAMPTAVPIPEIGFSLERTICTACGNEVTSAVAT